MIAKRSLAIRSAALLLVILLGAVSIALHPRSATRATYTSPSGNYRLVVHSYGRFLSAPGDSTGAPGFVKLFNSSGKKLAESKIPLVLDVSSPDDIRWYEHDVTVTGVFDFPIPHP